MGLVHILDIGGDTLKVGTSADDAPKIVPNCISKVKSERRRLFIGDQLDDCKDFSSLFYILPFQRGYLINYDVQKQIWDFVFKSKFNCSEFKESSLLFTQPYFNFKSIQENMMEIFFEEYSFGALCSTNPSHLSFLRHMSTVERPNSHCCLMVDSGYSNTHIIPIVKGKKVKTAIRRIDVGGKALTNYLKDVISYRQLHVLDETFVINQCKEDCCYVSLQLDKDLEHCKSRSNDIIRDYVLPDFTTLKRGYARSPSETTPITDQQIIKLNNERFQVPEILFYPSDVQINQIGLSHSIIHSIESTSVEDRPYLYENIHLVGGNASFPGIRERIESDVRSMADHFYDVNVTTSRSPITDSWFGGHHLVNEQVDLFKQMCLTKSEYEEKGTQACLSIFDI